MDKTLHITSGDCVGKLLKQSGICGDLLVWRDILYEGPRKPCWPDDEILKLRAHFLVGYSGGGLGFDQVMESFNSQYGQLKNCGVYERILLWFDGCLFDQSMLVHILSSLASLNIEAGVELICINAFEGIEPFHGLGQLSASQMSTLAELCKPVTPDQFEYAVAADDIFALKDSSLLSGLARNNSAPLPFVPAAAARLLDEMPSVESGLGRLETLIFDALGSGCSTPLEVFKYVSDNETPPQYWGDTTLWQKINGLAERHPPLLTIEGPASRLPQWTSNMDLNEFKITPVSC